MYIFPLGLIFCILSFDLAAGISTPKNVEPLKTAAEVYKALEPEDISGISARIRVEDAQFRAFNLFLPSFQMGAITPAQRKTAADIRQVLERDLAITGSFHMMSGEAQGKFSSDELLKQKGAEGSSRCRLDFSGQKIKIAIVNKNLLSGKATNKSFEADPAQYRRLAHLLAHSIFEEFIGPEDLFLLQIAAVKREKNQSQIVLLDFDGHNETTITTGPWSKSSPYFSPDGKTILYSVASDQGHGIVEQRVGTSSFEFRLKMKGINLDPRVLPDNSGLLATLSYGKSANIYKTTRTGQVLQAITEDKGMNLSPTISPDGKTFAFVSTRGGSAQIYEQAFPTGKNIIPAALRLTHKGEYNQTPHYSPDGKFLAFTGRDQRAIFDVFIYERDSKNISRVTQNQGRNQEPFFTPSSRFVIFVSEREGRKSPDVYLATLNGNHQYRLTTSGGYYSPVIRPLQK